MNNKDYQQLLPALPNLPGVYKFIDSEGKLIYVGKAKNIRKRVSSYFNRSNNTGKTEAMVKVAARVEFTIVNSEQDALLLENNLIKNFQPRYNVNLKDGKSYPYICIKKERFPRVFLTRRFIRDGSEYYGPYTSVKRVETILEYIRGLFPLRNCNLNLSEKNIANKKFKVCLEYHLGNCKGPCEGLQSEEDYNNSIQQIRNILKGDLKVVIDTLKTSMNEYASLLQFEQAEALRKKIDMLREYQSHSTVVNPKISNVDVFAFTDGEKTAFVNYMKLVNGSVIQTKTIELHKKIEEQKEDLLSLAVNQLRSEFNSQSDEIIVPFKISPPDEKIRITIPSKGDKRKLLELAEKNVSYYKLNLATYSSGRTLSSAERILKQLQEDLRMKELPTRIECFDNSNFQGSYPVASMVVFKNAKPSKKDYRHFNIKTVEGPNDFASMEEIIYRRYKKFGTEENIEQEYPKHSNNNSVSSAEIEENEDTLPQLIIIDGGKGQLSSAVKILEQLGLLGKVTVVGIAKRLEEIYFPDDSLPLYINKKSESLKLIQRIRDEAHRFAITFHRKKREKGTLKSELTDINGIGSATSEKLLRHFRSMEKIRNATGDEIAEVIGKAKAEKVIEQLQSKEKVQH